MPITINDEQFQQLINQALESLPGEHVKNIENVAILFEEQPSVQQLTGTKPGYTLLGLYEGVPLSERQGHTMLYPDRITLFKGPLCAKAHSMSTLQEEIRHTLWHEIGHYYGLNHKDIAERE